MGIGIKLQVPSIYAELPVGRERLARRVRPQAQGVARPTSATEARARLARLSDAETSAGGLAVAWRAAVAGDRHGARGEPEGGAAR